MNASGPVAVILSLERVEPLADGIEARVRVASPEWMRTTVFPRIAQETLTLLPGLARHRCESGSPHGIVAELADTETPHLVEHVALELLALAGWSRETRGRTHWDFARDGAGVFRVRLSCGDAGAGRIALDGAVGIVVWLLAHEGERPEVEALVEALRQVRDAGSRI